MDVSFFKSARDVVAGFLRERVEDSLFARL